jgi:hypothetical protein
MVKKAAAGPAAQYDLVALYDNSARKFLTTANF